MAKTPDPQKPTNGSISARIAHFINSIAAFLSTAQGFVSTFIILLVGMGIGAMVQFNETFVFSFNIFLSVAAIVIAGIILVSAARGEAALHVKLDYLIEYSKASNKVIGLEHRELHEIEAERKKVEEEAETELEDVVEREVAEEVAEQLDKRARPGRK